MLHFLIFCPLEKMAWDDTKWGRDDFFLLIHTLPTFWAERIWILRFFIFAIFWSPNFWISRSPDLQIPRFPGSQISRRRRRRTNSQIPTWPLSQRTQGSNTSQGALAAMCNKKGMEIIAIQIRSVQNVDNVWISRGKHILSLVHTISGEFPMDTKLSFCCRFSLVVLPQLKR